MSLWSDAAFRAPLFVQQVTRGTFADGSVRVARIATYARTRSGRPSTVREVVLAVEGWADAATPFDSMRGGPFPGKRVFPRERKEEVGEKEWRTPAGGDERAGRRQTAWG